MTYRIIDSPMGQLLLIGDQLGLKGLYTPGHHWPSDAARGHRDDIAFDDVAVQLREYFDGRRMTFDVTLAPTGTDFQRRVWQELQAIPYGQTTTYGDIARSLGRPTASRAVGAANGRNPISIIVPCHRVIGSSGALTGYAGGLDAKRWLLKHERAVLDAGS